MAGLQSLPKAPDLVLVDTYNVLYKYHFKIKMLHTSDGIPCGGLYGVLRNLEGFINLFSSPRMVWVFDSIPTDKRSIDPEYKRNRSGRQEIRPQVEGLWEFLRMMRVPVLRVEGREADDLIAQVLYQAHLWAEKRKRDDLIFLLVTEDHDMFQLLDHNVFIYRHRSGEIITRAMVEEQYGVPPWRIPEIQAICGCPGDNVPSVPGFGEIKAIRAIAKYGDLKNAIEQDPKLFKHADRIRTNYLLVKQSGTVKIPFNIDHSALTHYIKKEWNKDKLQDMLRDWEFESLSKRWFDEGMPQLVPFSGQVATKGV